MAMSIKKIIYAASFALVTLCVFGTHAAHAAVVIAQQLDDSLTGYAQTGCVQCENITVGSQVFTAAISGNLGSLEVFTSGFGSNSRYPEYNDCYLTIYDQDTNTLLASSDDHVYGYACGSDIAFTFKNSQPFMQAGKQYRWNYVFGGQNFSRVNFIGGPNDTVGGSFNVAPLGGAKFRAFATILPPESLGQFLAVGTTTPIAQGGVASGSTITLAATLPAPLPDSLQLQVELEPMHISFNGAPNLTSDFTESGSSVQVIATELLNSGYHWQARSVDTSGNTSVWQPLGAIPENPDFYRYDPSTGIVLQDNTTAYHESAQPNPCGGDGTVFSCAFSPMLVHYQTPQSFTISKITFDWNNNGYNNCAGGGNYGAVLTEGSTVNSTVIATSTNTAYLGCANIGGESGNAELDFNPTTIPSDFYFSLGAFDNMLQGGSNISVSHIAILGIPTASSTNDTSVNTTSTPSDSDDTHNATSTKKTPVVIVPGILGSKLDKISDEKEIWPNADTMIISGSDSYLDALKLSPTGEQIPGMEMNPSDIVRTVTTSIPFTGEDFYKPLIDSLTAAGYREGIDLFVAPYDWRLDIASSAASISPVIENAIGHSPNGKIDILAHSMGGLVAKDYLSQLPEASSSIIDKLILVGTPQLGAPKMFKALQYGDDLGFHFGPIELLAPAEVKSIAQNMPGVYALLPSRRYVETQGGYVIDNRSGAHTVLDFDHTNDFLMSNSENGNDDAKRNAMLLARADTLHATQDFTPANAPSIYNIAGCQNPATISSFVIEDDGIADIIHGAGDGTVPISSAMNLANGYQTYFSLYSENGADHTGLINNANPLALINAILENTTSTLALAPLGISTSTQDCLQGRSSAHNETTIEISTHSPIALNAYDSQNRHTGPGTSNSEASTIDLQIPGSSYETIGENSFILLPASDTYRIVGDAQATGTFTMKIKSLDEAANFLGGTTYIQIPLASASSTATLTVSSSTPTPTLTLDAYGDGTTISIIAPTASLSASSSADTTPPDITMPTIPESVPYGTSLTFIFSAVDDLSGIATTRAILDGTAIANGTIINDLSEGPHVFRGEAIDNAGNPSSQTISFSIIPNTSNNTNTSTTTSTNNGTGLPVNTGGGNSQVVQVPAPIKPRCKKKITL
jgi:pimeloyl-ACP methyl ester carboxylesterase